MVTCTHCKTANGLDSKFCKSCGLELPQDAVSEALVKHDELVQEGYGLFNQGRTEEALLLAEMAIEQNPSSPKAHSLRGMCLEREARVAEALECYERVLELQPDSALDRIKVNQLRTLLAAQMTTQPAPNKKLALLGAAFAVVFVGAVGAIVATMSTRGAVAAETSKTGSSLGAPFSISSNVNNGGQTQADPNAQQQQQQQQSGGNQQSQQQSNNPFGGSSLGYGRIQNPTGPGLPGVNQSGVTGPIGSDPGFKPVQVPVPDDLKVERTEGTGTQQPVNDTSKGDTDPRPVEEQPKRPSVIHIEKVGGNSNSSGLPTGTQPIDEGTSENLTRVGQQQMLAGNYNAAAQTFEKALRQGAPAGSTNQRLGQCYSQLGRKNDAISAYTRAMAAYPDGSPQAKACQDALKLLRGN